MYEVNEKTNTEPKFLAAKQNCGEAVGELLALRHGKTNDLDKFLSWCRALEHEWLALGNPLAANSNVEDLERKLEWVVGQTREIRQKNQKQLTT